MRFKRINPESGSLYIWQIWCAYTEISFQITFRVGVYMTSICKGSLQIGCKFVASNFRQKKLQKCVVFGENRQKSGSNVKFSSKNAFFRQKIWCVYDINTTFASCLRNKHYKTSNNNN